MGNPGNYKTYFVGLNDACKFQVPERPTAAFHGATTPAD